MRLLLKENMHPIFFYVEDCMAASGNTSRVFKERATASEKILRKKCATASERKFAAASS